jgi:Zn-dependent protease with chaperone function
MTGSSIVSGAESIIGSFALLALILVALGTIIGLVKPSEVVSHVGVIVGLTIVAILIVSVFVGLWMTMSLWQKVILAAIGLAVWQMRREQRSERRKREDE